MPIKMTGSVRPTSLKSPDPVSMPIVNKLPALKENIEAIIQYGPSAAPPANPYTPGTFVQTDWLANGDSRATLDVTSGLEWLDLTETLNMSIAQVSALLSTTYAGWRLPTSAEVKTYMDHRFPGWASKTGVDGGTYTFAAHKTAAAEHLADLGTTNFYTTQYGSKGLHNGSFHPSYNIGWTGLDRWEDAVASISMSVLGAIGNDNNYKTTSLGVWLVSDGGTTLSSQNNPNINIPAV